MSKKRAIKSRINKSKFTLHEQRVRIFNRIKKVDLKKPAGWVKKGSAGTTAFIQRRPFVSFFVALLILALLIILGSTIFKTKPAGEIKPEGTKQVQTFKLGTAPKISVQAKVEKTNVIQIVAQTPGIVSNINVTEGQDVNRGQNLISLSSNYSGGNAASIQRQIAQNQYGLAKSTFQAQKEIISKQREVAQKTDDNSDEMRNIANSSLEETRSLLDLNESLLNQTNSNITDMQNTLTPSDNSNPLIFQANSQKAQLQSAVNQLRQAVRNTELQAAGDRPPAELSNLQREIALKNLDIQEKSLIVNNQITGLQLALAQVNEANMYPVTPFKGTVEKVHVRLGESVSPGDTLVTISGVSGKIILDAKVGASTAKNISQLEDSVITIGNQTINLKPAYVSSEATDGQLYSVIYHVPDEYQEFFTDAGFIIVSIPVGSPDTNSVVPFIPLDSIFQTQDDSIVYVVKDGKAQARKVSLGQVQGRFVAVNEGLGADDEIILSRNVVEGDSVKINQ